MKPIHRQHGLACLVMVIGVGAWLFPMLGVFSTQFIGDPFGDAYEYAHHIWWIHHALTHAQNPFHVETLAYPNGLGGAWLWGNPFNFAPAWMFLYALPLPTAYNLSIVFHLALNGGTMYWLGWRLLGHFPSALLMGIVFMLYPTTQAHLIASHVGLIALWGAVLWMIALENTTTRSHRWAWVWVALALPLAIGGSIQHLIFLVIPFGAIWFIKSLHARQGWAMRRMLLGGVIGLGLALVLIAPILQERTTTPTNQERGDVAYSTDLLAFVAPSFYNPIFSQLTYARNVLGEVKNVEGTAYLGILATCLAGVALFRVPPARWWGAIVVLGMILALGVFLKWNGEVIIVTIDGISSPILLPWGWVSRLPLLNIVRTPARFNFLVGAGMAVLAGYGVRDVWHGLKRLGSGRWLIGFAVVMGIAFEYQVMWHNHAPMIPTIPTLERDIFLELRDDPTIRAVFDIPYDHLLATKDGMFLVTVHHKPVIGGQITRRTPVSETVLAQLQSTLSPDLLQQYGADMVILHRQWATPELEAHAVQKLGTALYEDERFMVWRTKGQ